MCILFTKSVNIEKWSKTSLFDHFRVLLRLIHHYFKRPQLFKNFDFWPKNHKGGPLCKKSKNFNVFKFCSKQVFYCFRGRGTRFQWFKLEKNFFLKIFFAFEDSCVTPVFLWKSLKPVGFCRETSYFTVIFSGEYKSDVFLIRHGKFRKKFFFDFCPKNHKGGPLCKKSKSFKVFKFCSKQVFYCFWGRETRFQWFKLVKKFFFATVRVDLYITSKNMTKTQFGSIFW